MSTVHATDRTARIVPTEIADGANPTEALTLQVPDTVRQGEVPTRERATWSPFGGRLMVGALVALTAATLVVTTGCAIADNHSAPTTIEQVQEGEHAPVHTTVRGQFVEAPVPGGDAAGIWFVPIGNADHFTVEDQSYERLYIGVAGTETTAGMIPGGFGDLTGYVSAKPDGDATVPVIDAVDTIVPGLPRDMQGAVRLGAAPGAAPGADAKDLYLALDAPIWLDGARVEIVHLGPVDAPELAGLQPGDQVVLGGRVDGGQDDARLRSVTSLVAQHYPGSIVEAPTFDGTTFHAAGDAQVALQEIHLGDAADGRRVVVVVDSELGVAHFGSVGAEAGSERFDATLDVQTFLQGGPDLAVRGGQVSTADGHKLSPQTTWVAHGDDGDVHQGWYLHEQSNTLYQVGFRLDAEGHTHDVQVRHAIDLDATR